MDGKAKCVTPEHPSLSLPGLALLISAQLQWDTTSLHAWDAALCISLDSGKDKTHMCKHRKHTGIAHLDKDKGKHPHHCRI